MESQKNPAPTDEKPLPADKAPQGWVIVETSTEDTLTLPEDFADNDHDGMG